MLCPVASANIGFLGWGAFYQFGFLSKNEIQENRLICLLFWWISNNTVRLSWLNLQPLQIKYLNNWYINALDIYVIIGAGRFTGGNIRLSVGEDGVVVIDDSMPPLLGRMKTAIKTITNKPVDFLINTHVHGDHTGNNESIGQGGARIVAHENLRLNMINKG